MAYRSDGVVCWLVRAAGLQPGHALALLTTQTHARFLAAEWNIWGPFQAKSQVALTVFGLPNLCLLLKAF